MKRNGAIDLLKLISALFIVVVHSSYPSDFGFAMNAIARFSVPIFFMITGYYVVQSEDKEGCLKKQIIKLAKYYVFYEFLYVFYAFCLALVQHDLHNFKVAFLLTLKNFFISPVVGIHLWYVVNVIWVLVIISIFRKFSQLTYLFAGSILLHVAGILLSHLSVQLLHWELPLAYTRNFLFFGLFYVMLGYFLQRVDIEKLKKYRVWLLLVGVGMAIAQSGERYLWTTVFHSVFADYYFTTIVASIALFLFALCCEVKNKTIAKISRYSMPIYFLHIFVIQLLWLFCYNATAQMRGSILGNTAYILLVCVLSGGLYALVKKLFTVLRNKIKPEPQNIHSGIE